MWWARIAAAIVLPVLLLALLEGALRIADVGFPTSLTVPCTVSGESASCYNLFFTAPYFPPGIIHTPKLFAIPAVKPPQTYRIFILGESAAMGDPDPAFGFGRYLEVMLRNRYPEMNFEIVNTGTVAINSHVALPIARGVAAQKPDVVIIYSGNNETVGPYGPGTAFTSSVMWMPVVRSSIYYHTTRIGQLLTRIGVQKQEWRGMEMFLDKQVPATSPLLPQAYANFERNLRDTIDVSRSAGARVIVSTVATDLRDCAPFGSMHRAGLSEMDLARWSESVKRGADAEDAQDFSGALTAYRTAETIDDRHAGLAFRIARVLLATGDVKSARTYFVRARDLDTLRFRADSRVNDVNRAVATSMGAELVDAEQLLAENSRDGVPGSELLYEHVHLTPEGNYLLARAMFLQIARNLARPPQPADVPSEAQCEQWLAFTAHDRRRIAHEMLDRIQKPPFSNQLTHSELLLRLSMVAQAPDENPQQTASQYQWALQQAPNDRNLHYNFGRFLFRYDPQAGAEELRRSRPWDGFPVTAPNGAPL